MKPFAVLIATALAAGLGAAAQGGGPADQLAATPTPSGVSGAQSGPASALSKGIFPVNSHLAALVPAGMSTQEACTGFRNIDECATALHASQNLGIPFAALKSRVAGGGENLGAAIHRLKPEANAMDELRKAELQAHNDLHGPQG